MVPLSQLIWPLLLTRVPLMVWPFQLAVTFLLPEELGLRRHSLLVAESQVAAALVDRASIGTIAIALPGALSDADARHRPPLHLVGE